MANEQEQEVRKSKASSTREVDKREGRDPGEEKSDDLFSGLSQIDPQLALGVVGDFAKANPHVALAGGVAVGFLLGGGLTPRLLGAIGLIAARRYLKKTVNETIESVLSEDVLQRS